LEVGEPAQWRDGQGRLTLAGRILIEVRVGDRVPPSQIAAELGVHRSTVSREMKRCPGRYRAQPAQRLADWSRRRPKDRKLVLGTPLWDEVVTRLNNKHSPQQIAHRLRQDFPEDPTMWVSHETIYQALYVQAAGGLRHELTVEKALRSGRTTRGPRSRLSGRGSRSWIGEATITNRPAEVEDRAVPGHWEGDLIIGKGGTYSLTLDDGTRLWPAGTEIPFYRPTTRHRALAYYTILSDTFQGYDHAILMRGIRDILTKPFIESDMLSTSKTSDDFGSDPISVIDIWYGDGYINVHFGANHGGTKRHLVNLVQVSQSGIPPYVFEFRHNAFGDPPRYGRRAFVAFDMAKLKFPAGSDSTVTVRVKTFDGEKRYKIVCRRSVDKTIPYEARSMAQEELIDVE